MTGLWLVYHRPGLLPDWCITGLFTYISGAGHRWSPCWPVMTSSWPLAYIRDQYSCSICCAVLIAWLNELWVWAAVHTTECQDSVGTVCDQLQCRYYIFISSMFLIHIRWCRVELIWCVADVWVVLLMSGMGLIRKLNWNMQVCLASQTCLSFSCTPHLSVCPQH